MTEAEKTRSLNVKIVSWHPRATGALRGHATIELGALRIMGVSIFARGADRWCILPGRPMLENGQQKVTTEGRAMYGVVLEWTNKDTESRFRDAVFEAMEREHPDALQQT